MHIKYNIYNKGTLLCKLEPEYTIKNVGKLLTMCLN